MMKANGGFIVAEEERVAQQISLGRTGDSNGHTTPQTATSLPSRIEFVRPIYHQISDFCYDFDPDGILRQLQTGETLSIKMTSTGPSLKRQEVIRAIPGHPSKCMRVLHSANFFTHKGPIIIVLQGGGVAHAGVWAPRLLLHPQHGLRSGSQISLVQKAHEQGYAIAIINANEHVPDEAEMDAMDILCNSHHPVFDSAKCMHIDPNFKTLATNDNCNSYVADLSLYPTAPDQSKKLLLPVTENKSCQPTVCNKRSSVNPIFIVPCSKSSSAMSWLLTGPNSTSNSTVQTHCNPQNTSIHTTVSGFIGSECSLVTSTPDSLNTHTKVIGISVNTSSSSLSSSLKTTHLVNNDLQSQRNAFSVLPPHTIPKHLMQASQNRNTMLNDTNPSSASNCQTLIEHSTCINPGIDNGVEKPSPNCQPSASSSTGPISYTAEKSRTFCENFSVNDESEMLGVSVEDRLYGMWRQLIPHCASNNILVWAHQRGAHAFIHPFKPIPGAFPGFSTPITITSNVVSSVPNDIIKQDKSEESHQLTNNQPDFVILSSTKNIPLNSASHSKDSDNQFDLQNDLTIKDHPRTEVQTDESLQSSILRSKRLNCTVLSADVISQLNYKKPRLFSELSNNNPVSMENTSIVESNDNSDNVHNDVTGMSKRSDSRFSRRRHSSAQAMLRMFHRNDNGARKGSHILKGSNNASALTENDYTQTKHKLPPNPTEAPSDTEKIKAKDSATSSWRDRRVYGPWRRLITPEASRRALLFTENLRRQKATYSEQFEKRSYCSRLPGASGSDSDATHFAECGGAVSRTVGVWSDNDAHNNENKLLDVRLARAWQRKAERMWLELKSRVKAVVFTDSAELLDLRLEGVGWGLNLLQEHESDSELPFIYRSSVYREELPEKIINFRQWLSQHSVNFIAADLETGTRLNAQIDTQEHVIPILSSGTTEHDLIPSTVLDHVFDFFQSKLRASSFEKDNQSVDEH
ncbi:unnamed protein product [Heterobilharzia americana]|nr:unnamed protein product [Heterobilharzia americana]